MEGGLDQTVERCASMLLLEDLNQIKAGRKLLEAVRHSPDLSNDDFSRVAQEVAAFQGGAVMSRFLSFVTPASVSRLYLPGADSQLEGLKRFLHATPALCHLTGSKIVVDRFLRDDTGTIQKVRAENVHIQLMNQVTQVVDVSERMKSSMFNPLEIMTFLASLECLSNFARASKTFRDVMKEPTEQRKTFEQFSDLRSSKNLAKMTAGSSLRLRLGLACLAASFAFAEDSQLWAIDSGLLKLLAAIYEASPLRELCKRNQRGGSPVYRCNKILYRLLTLEATTEKARAHNALEGFRPHRRKMNAAEPELALWRDYFGPRLQGTRVVEKEELSELQSAENWKHAEEVYSAMFQTPVVCSWKLCAAGREPVLGKGFSMCARCHVARYCSKEHQKSHWPSHKVHCRKMP
ncbi:hypothetical protein KFL_003220140 [Klebsormidium nitens]|uniref:MYND-type domain-containing protein n=1 Tax=Klebsormidium nitens TaxID=105231 RepID=A0A1Y1IAG6_KLENI|nr:hypothetical protein KFL_003220140 [Klebsormidium nitens]|eukprot:GAQ86952.1 hypothetical protein KFL_003220140 [Klebsormidium nitens]